MKCLQIILIFIAILGIITSGLFMKVAYADDDIHQVNQLHQSLDKFTMAEKLNSIIRLDLPGQIESENNTLVRKFETEWNSGQYQTALETIDLLGETTDIAKIGFEVEWKTPIPTEQTPNSMECVRVGNRDSIYVNEYDIDRSNGNLMAVLALQGDGYASVLTTNFSDDNGASWVETFYYQSASIILDADCAVYDGYCIVAFAVDFNYINARRFIMTSGAQVHFPSGGSSAQIAYNGTMWDEISLISIQDIDTHGDYVDKFYLAANDFGSNLYLYRANEDAESWTEYVGGISNAWGGIDICINEVEGTVNIDNIIFASYFDSSKDINIAGWTPWTGWSIIHTALCWSSEAYVTSIDAYDDNVYCVYDDYTSIFSVNLIRMSYSSDGGDNWFQNNVLGDLSYNCTDPDVTARAGVGMAATHRKVGNFSIVNGYLEWGDYDMSPLNGPTTAYTTPAYHSRPCVELLNSGKYGTLYSRQPLMSPTQAYFCTEGSCCITPGDANNDKACNIGDAVYIINYAFKGGPAPACMPAADANDDGSVNVGDAVYIINYAFKGGPAPTCSS